MEFYPLEEIVLLVKIAFCEVVAHPLEDDHLSLRIEIFLVIRFAQCIDFGQRGAEAFEAPIIHVRTSHGLKTFKVLQHHRCWNKLAKVWCMHLAPLEAL